MELHWTYEKPSKKGFYMINNGDVETDQTMQPVKVDEHPTDGLYIVDMDGEVSLVSDIHSSWKFAELNEPLKKAPTK